MRILVFLLMLGSGVFAQTQRFFGLAVGYDGGTSPNDTYSVVGRYLSFGYGQVLPEGYWVGLFLNTDLSWGGHLYLRREGTVSPLVPLGLMGIGFGLPGAYYVGLGVEGRGFGKVAPSLLWGVEASLGVEAVPFLELATLVAANPSLRAHFGVRYYPSGWGGESSVRTENLRLYPRLLAGLWPSFAVAYEGEGYALWATPYPDAVLVALGGHLYVGSFSLGLAAGSLLRLFGPPDRLLLAAPYVGYSWVLGRNLEGRLELFLPIFFPPDAGPYLLPIPIPSLALTFAL